MRLNVSISVDNAAFRNEDGDVDETAVQLHLERWIRGGFVTDAQYAVGTPQRLFDWNGNQVGAVWYTRLDETAE